MAEIFKEYFSAQAEMELEFGPDSIALMMVGDFYEMYGVHTSSVKLGRTEEAHTILNMSMSRKNKSLPHSQTNPHMVGFPCHALEEHIGKFLRANYTVGVWNQYDIPNKKTKGRRRERVYTPSTFINDDTSDPNNLMVCALGEYKSPKGVAFKKFHLVVISLNTGKVQLQEHYDHERESRAENELYRLIHTNNPSEIIFCDDDDQKEFAKMFDIPSTKKIYVRKLNPTFLKESYQNEFLKKVYPACAVESVNVTAIEWLDLERWSSLVPYFIAGLSFAYEQNKTIVSKIQKPQVVNNKNQLILSGDSIYQLNLVRSPFDSTSLFDIICKAETPMGRRCFQSRLLNPLKSPQEIEQRYALVEKMGVVYEQYDLSGIGDIEKRYRKMVSGSLHPFEFSDLKTSYENCLKVLQTARELFEIPDALIQRFQELVQECTKTFDFKLLKSSKFSDIKGNFFQPGVNKALDEMQQSIDSGQQLLQEIATVMSEYIDSKDPAVKLDSTEKEGYYLTTTNKRFKMLPSDLAIDFEYRGKTYTIHHDKLDIAKLTSSVKIRTPEIKKVSFDILSQKERMNQKICEAYLATLDGWVAVYGELLQQVADTIAHIDFIYSAAKTAKEFGYVRPKIVDKLNGKSWFSVVGGRHPIVERINSKVQFSCHDFSLGLNEHTGTIVYGLNMSGKSTFLRAMGCIVVMAQTGLYVPCDTFEYYPFSTCLSKMTIRDNMSKGQSTFMVEVLEIKNMLLYSSPTTLVLSDELCSSTESTSAHAIVAQTLHQLSEGGSKFIFSTHLHELQKMDVIRADPHIKICHFKVHVEGERIIFDRTLSEGGLSELYGLEVARTLGLPSEFMRGAFAIRDALTGENSEILSTKSSRYNRDVYVDQCAHCGATENLHTHHIVPQKDADAKGLIQGKFHKNAEFNLEILCIKCHQLHHHTDRK